LQESAVVETLGLAFEGRSVFFDAYFFATDPGRIFGETAQDRLPRPDTFQQIAILAVE
jgi:hypothetical protein